MGKGGQMQPQQQVQTTKTSDIPEIYKPYVSDVLSRAQSESNQGYTPYNAQRIAQFTPEQLQAFSMVPGAANAYQGSLADAAQSAQLSTQQFPNVDISKYINPYVQNVVDVQKNQAQRDYDIAQAGRDAAAARSNAFGGGRAFVENSMAQDNLARLKDQIQAQGLSSAWTNAGQLFNQDRASALSASQNLQGLGAVQQGLGLNAANAVAGVGAQKQGMEQSNLSQSYQDFLNQRDWNKNQINWLSSVVQGFNPQATDSTTNEMKYAAAPSTSTQLLGLGSILAGGAKLGGLWKDGGLVGYADGGSVKGYKDGETVKNPYGGRKVNQWGPFWSSNPADDPSFNLPDPKEDDKGYGNLTPLPNGEVNTDIQPGWFGRGISRFFRGTHPADAAFEAAEKRRKEEQAQNIPIDTRKDENGIGAFAAPAPKPTGGIAAGAKTTATPKTTGGINPDAKAPETAVGEGKKVSLEDYLKSRESFKLPEEKPSNALAMALIKGGAKAMQTPGNFGQALGAGVEGGIAGYEEALKGEREARKAKVDELKAVQEINLAIERGDLEKAKIAADIAKENMETPAGRLALKKAESEIDAHRATAKKATAEAEQLIPAHAEFYRKYGDVIGDKTPADIRMAETLVSQGAYPDVKTALESMGKLEKPGAKREVDRRKFYEDVYRDAVKNGMDSGLSAKAKADEATRALYPEHAVTVEKQVVKNAATLKGPNQKEAIAVKPGDVVYFDYSRGIYIKE